MHIHEIWEKALKNTEIIRSRIKPLMTFNTTELRYVFLAESSINIGDTIVRNGNVMVEKPRVILPPSIPQFEGFNFEDDLHINKDTIINFLLVRGIHFPSLKYKNQISTIDIHEGSLSKAVKHYSNELARTEDVECGLVIGPEDCWQFSVLIFICSMIQKSSGSDIKNIIKYFEDNQ